MILRRFADNSYSQVVQLIFDHVMGTMIAWIAFTHLGVLMFSIMTFPYVFLILATKIQ